MIGARLYRARKAAGLSLRAVGGRIGLSHAAIKKYEDGVSIPSSDVLLRLARALGVRVEYLLRPDPVPQARIEFRKAPSAKRKAADAIGHQLLEQVERRLELEAFFPQPPVAPFALPASLIQPISSLNDVEESADALRDAWALGGGALSGLADALERRGIWVLSVAVDTLADGAFYGLSARVGDRPLIAVGRHWSGERQRVVLASELAHLVLHGRIAPGLDEERVCDRFAAAFLLPRAAAVAAIGSHRSALDVRELALLKSEFGLSIAAIVDRALALGIISAAYRHAVVKRFAMDGWQATEASTPLPAESPRHFQRMVFCALVEGYIGEAKAAELMVEN